ncbi:hypothetical protein TCAL_11093 [Tigriopus californicus]|uniref:CMP/dCMP-type deaminase domain-containing protein n=1 Tax=Tigriopus californicus TaxID=6832 RepID=A0A553P7Q7_TIGCA|nr:tRNA-specific adenosine deaminase 2-like [Tigriopus californicus]TRY73718.1 hypothetical protein TCAL_11093 [Tigriopus californicus]|eukprot:TCALIF_11093-PA protein Name:"Similar to Adat2 tRNA-specific adenosine deaminase 2 (Mus musculus)" AED:0.07 eAED:0.07 QI:0/-1/0/1/-1/1/1/0/220
MSQPSLSPGPHHPHGPHGPPTPALIEPAPPAAKKLKTDTGPADPDVSYNPRFMDLCFDKAREALHVGEVPIGCVFVREGHVVHAARNRVNETRNPTLHAEIVAIQALERQIRQGQGQSTGRLAVQAYFNRVVVYVNCEPCIMCASALQQVGVQGIFFGCANPRFGGCGTVLDVFQVDHTRRWTPFVQQGFRAHDAIELLKEFYKGENPNAPPEKRKPARK